MKLAPADLDRIEALARKVEERIEHVWANDRSTEDLDDAKEQLENRLVYNPDTVLALVEAAREKERLLGLLADPLMKVVADYLAELMKRWLAARDATPAPLYTEGLDTCEQVARIRVALRGLPHNEARLTATRGICKECGRTDEITEDNETGRPCQCSNDE